MPRRYIPTRTDLARVSHDTWVLATRGLRRLVPLFLVASWIWLLVRLISMSDNGFTYPLTEFAMLASAWLVSVTWATIWVDHFANIHLHLWRAARREAAAGFVALLGFGPVGVAYQLRQTALDSLAASDVVRGSLISTAADDGADFRADLATFELTCPDKSDVSGAKCRDLEGSLLSKYFHSSWAQQRARLLSDCPSSRNEVPTSIESVQALWNSTRCDWGGCTGSADATNPTECRSCSVASQMLDKVQRDPLDKDSVCSLYTDAYHVATGAIRGYTRGIDCAFDVAVDGPASTVHSDRVRQRWAVLLYEGARAETCVQYALRDIERWPLMRASGLRLPDSADAIRSCMGEMVSIDTWPIRSRPIDALCSH